MHSKVFISVIIPVYNGEKYLSETIESIQMQNMRSEIIAVDDGCTDRSMDIAKSYGCVCLKNIKNLGPIASRRKGLMAASGAYVFFQDQDDLLCENALATLAQYLDQDHELSIVIAKRKDFLSPDVYGSEDSGINIKRMPYFGAVSGASLLRRSKFLDENFFSNEYNTVSGEAFYLKKFVEEHNLKILKIDLTVTLRRIHGNNYSITNFVENKKDFSKLLRIKVKRGTRPAP